MLAWIILLCLGVGVLPGIPPVLAQNSVSELEKPVSVSSNVPCPSPDLYSPNRPDPPGTPTLVGIAVWFQDLAQLSDVDQTLDTDVYVLLRWRDKRLADPSRGDAAADCKAPDGELWMPAIEPDNLRAQQRFYDRRFIVDSRGMITYFGRTLVKTANALDFRDFPIDHHRWKFTLWPTISHSDEVLFHPLFAGRNEQLTIQGWRVGQLESKVGVVERPPRNGTYARYDLFLELERDWEYYLWKLGLPLTLIVLMAYGVYYIPSAAAAQQVGLGMTSVLTLIAYMLALGNSLPKISYLTRADRFFIGSAILVFLGLVKAVLTIVLKQDDNNQLIQRANKIGRVLYPLAMVLNFALAFLL